MKLTTLVILLVTLSLCISLTFALGRGGGNGRAHAWGRGNGRGHAYAYGRGGHSGISGGETTTEAPEDPTTTESSCPGTEEDPCACPEGFTPCAGRCYFLDTTTIWGPGNALNYDQAIDYCAERGSVVATPRSQAEEDCAGTAYGQVGNVLWLGYRKNPETGEWIGADGLGASDHTNWTPGEPDDLQCVLRADQGWIDETCSHVAIPFCQLDSCYRPDCLEV